MTDQVPDPDRPAGKPPVETSECRTAVVPEPPATGRRRVNPHEARARRPSGRSDDATARQGPAALARPAAAADAVVRLDDPVDHVLVASFEEEPWSEAERELLGAARTLAEGETRTAVLLVRIDQSSAPGDAAAHGADRLVTLTGVGQPDRAAEAILSLVAAHSPRHLVFADAPVDGDVARRVAAALGERPAVAVQKLTDGSATGRCDGGRQELSRPVPRVLLMAAGAGEIREAAPRREARVLPAPGPSASAIVDLGPEPMDAGSVPLDKAAFIVSGGDGVTDWQGLRDLAGLLSAAIGGSRQVCDAGHLPRSRQVGASGTLVAAKCYLAFGISGAPQHLQGVARCRHVVAVNVDLHAAMVRRADLAIIADAQAVMPALAEIARERRHGG